MNSLLTQKILVFNLQRFILCWLCCILTCPIAMGEVESAIPQEKAYLHFDNTGYFVGETMHFKAYVVNTCGGHLSDTSRVLYVELLSPDAELMAFQKIRLEKGLGEGGFLLDSISGAGFYEVRAYTLHMAAWGMEACFSRVFPIFEKPHQKGDYTNKNLNGVLMRRSVPTKSYSKRRGHKGNSLKVAFYPEGGHYVKNLSNRMAFTVSDNVGKPICTEVQLQDKHHRVLETVKTDSDGRGVVSVNATASSYLLYLPKTSQFSAQEFSLPVPEPIGCSLNVDAVENDSIVQISMSATDNLNGRLFALILQHEGIVKNQHTFEVEKQPQTFSLRKSELPRGVNLLTLSDTEGRIWAERMFFLFPKDTDEGRISIQSQPRTLTPCGRVTLNFKTLPNATFSLAVMDAAAMPCRVNQTVRVWKLLSSELRGYISHPQTYIESDDLAHRAATDRLMMVQGWRKYDWVRSKAETTSSTLCIPPIPRPYEYKELVENGVAQIEPTSKEVYFYDIMRLNTDIKLRGKSFPILLNWLADVNPYFEGSWNTIYAPRSINPYWPIQSRFKNDASANYGREKKLTNEQLGIWTFGPSYKRGSIVWFLNGRFLYITSSKGKIDWDDSEPFERVSKTGRLPYETQYVRNVEIVEGDKDFLRYLPNVKKWRGSIPTMIFITTIHHGAWEEDDSVLDSCSYNRLSTFEPNYANQLPHPEDFRRTLLWNPNIKTDAEGQALVEFYNNSNCTNLLISAEGIASDGTPLCNE